MKLSLFTLVLLVAVVLVTVDAVAPISRALPITTTSNINTDAVIPLAANVPIPDGGELNWPLNVQDSTGAIVQDIAVELDGLWHEAVSDLKITLTHNEQTSVIIDSIGGTRTFGRPRVPSAPDQTTVDKYLQLPPTGEVLGDGLAYAWTDGDHTNLALNQPTSQSSTQYNGTSGKAVDGNRSGFYSDSSVTHTGDAITVDPQPWWEVDVGSGRPHNVATIGTIRLWNRVPETSIAEIQRVSLRALNTITPDFTFTLSFTHRGVTLTTGPISNTAPASYLDETQSTHGQSMQAMLEAVVNVGKVSVTRSGPFQYGGYDWTITFLTEPGALPQLVPHFTVTSACSFVPSVTVDTLRVGSVNTWNNPAFSWPGSTIFPCWVVVSNVSAQSTTLQQAIAASGFRRYLVDANSGVFSDNQRETTIVLPTPTVARYVRLQRLDSDYLSIAEVEVYSDQFRLMSVYASGSPIVPQTFQPQYSLRNVFAGMPMQGQWVLTITDSVRRSVDYRASPPKFVHGAGGLSTWKLVLKDAHGNVHSYPGDVVFNVKTLPQYGSLYYYNATSGRRGDMITFTPTLDRYLGRCYNGDCSSRYGVGVSLSTSTRGSIAISTNRILRDANSYSVVYVPNERWTGQDYFTYTAWLGATESSEATVNVNVRKCRGSCYNDIVNDLALPLR